MRLDRCIALFNICALHFVWLIYIDRCANNDTNDNDIMKLKALNQWFADTFVLEHDSRYFFVCFICYSYRFLAVVCCDC